MDGWSQMAKRVLMIAGAAALLSACASYPSEPRYSTRPMPLPGSMETAPPVAHEPAPPAAAPYDPIDSSPLPPAGVQPPPQTGPDYLPDIRPGQTTPAPFAPGVAYVIQPGDTISGVSRRFGAPLQALIHLNGLGPEAAIVAGRSLILPDTAVDAGPDPYATGPSPRGVLVPDNGSPPPPPPPSSPPATPPSSPPPATTPPATQASGQGMFQWPVRGQIVRPFGQVGVSERNNGIHIAAAAASPVRAAAGGRVGYVGADQPGLGLTVVIVHRDGWRTVYAHLGEADVGPNQDVTQGQQIGTVGLTAGDGRPSVVFEIRQMRDGQPTPVDPVSVLPR